MRSRCAPRPARPKAVKAVRTPSCDNLLNISIISFEQFTQVIHYLMRHAKKRQLKKLRYENLVTSLNYQKVDAVFDEKFK